MTYRCADEFAGLQGSVLMCDECGDDVVSSEAVVDAEQDEIGLLTPRLVFCGHCQ